MRYAQYPDAQYEYNGIRFTDGGVSSTARGRDTAFYARENVLEVRLCKRVRLLWGLVQAGAGALLAAAGTLGLSRALQGLYINLDFRVLEIPNAVYLLLVPLLPLGLWWALTSFIVRPCLMVRTETGSHTLYFRGSVEPFEVRRLLKKAVELGYPLNTSHAGKHKAL